MTTHPTPRTQLAEAEAARSALVAATSRSRGFHLAVSLLLGVALASWLYGIDRSPAFWGVAAVTLAIGVGLSIWDDRARRRRGRVLDERATKAQFGRFLVAYLPLTVVAMLRPSPPVSLEWAVLSGAAAALFAYVLQRWDQAYQAKRLGSGDYGPYDVV